MDGSGTVTGTTTTTTTVGAFCGSNPGHPLCSGGDGTLGTAGSGGNGTGDEEQSSFGGSCASTSCGGDAIQCAIAQEQHKRNCEFFPQDTTMSSVGQSAANGQDTPSGHPGAAGQGVTVNAASQVNMTNPFGGTCPGDVSINVLGVSQSIPLGSACTGLTFMGLAAVAFTLLVAARIIFEGV
jgi:hypothetical protein